MRQPALTPATALKLATALYFETRERDSRLEAEIIRDPRSAMEYARDVLQAPWPEAEAVIATGRPRFMYLYARDVLRAPWPEAEAMIAVDDQWSYLYVQDVIKTHEDWLRFREIRRWISQD